MAFVNRTTPGLPPAIPDWVWRCEGPPPAAIHILFNLYYIGQRDEKGYMLSAVVMVGIMCAIFLEQVICVFRNIKDRTRVLYIVWIGSIYPVMGALNLLVLFVPRAATVFTFAQTYYFGVALNKVFALTMHYYGGKHGMVEALHKKTVSTHPFPCCFVCCCGASKPMTMHRLNVLHGCIRQVYFVYPLAYFGMTALWLENEEDSDITAIIPRLLDGCASLSSFLSVYAIIVINRSNRFCLEEYGNRAKFVIMNCVVGLNTIQAFSLWIASTAGTLGCGFPYPAGDKRIEIYNSWMLLVELFALQLIAWYFFRANDKGAKCVKTCDLEEYRAWKTASVPIENKTDDLALPQYNESYQTENEKQSTSSDSSFSVKISE